MKYILMFCFLILLSCTKNVGPQDFLKSFIEYRFSSKLTYEGLLEMTDGALKERILNLTEEDKVGYLKTDHLRFKKVKMDLITCIEDKNECNITYTVSYDQLKSGTVDVSAEVKKIAQLKKIEEKWKIVEIDEVKTYFENKSTINP
jgi:hypothetical protein